MAIVAAQNQAGPNGPSHTGGDQTAGPGLSNTGGNQLPEQGENHTGNNSGQTHVGPNNTGGNQTVEQSPSNTGNTGDVPDLPNYMESQGYEPNKGSVGNMGEFLKQSGFGNAIKDNTQKTNQQYQGQSIYKATDNVGDYIKKGDQLYLDNLHKDHVEVFDKRGNFKAVVNLDGTINKSKTDAAIGRKLK